MNAFAQISKYLSVACLFKAPPKKPGEHITAHQDTEQHAGYCERFQMTVGMRVAKGIF